MARNRETVQVEHAAGPPDVSGEDITGTDATLRFDGTVLVLWFTRMLQPYEVIIPAAGLASVDVGAQQRNKNRKLRLNVYDGDAYEVEFKSNQGRAFVRLLYALSARGVHVTEQSEQQSSDGWGFFIGF